LQNWGPHGHFGFRGKDPGGWPLKIGLWVGEKAIFIPGSYKILVKKFCGEKPGFWGVSEGGD